MPPLADDQRRDLEKVVIAARDLAEEAARAALAKLAVERAEPFVSMGPEQRRLRNALRAHARRSGGGAEGYARLVEEIAYIQWHRMLFARFLAENDLLMHPEGAPLTIEECADLALEEGETDAWELAARYASTMLPGIFARHHPAVKVRFAPEARQALDAMLADLPRDMFIADDALGWVYQFWQARRKKDVSARGAKIGAGDVSPVTQLFTEDYMVQFLLHNTLGAWWAARHPASPLIQAFTFLRRTADGVPVAGTFPGWPQRAAEVTVIDPCCGSGHFLVAAFELLRRMRIEEEGLSVAEATVAVIRDNLFGLELDARCTRIAAFALAFAAWKAAGYRRLPLPNIVCSGIPIAGSVEEWTRSADDDPAVRTTLERLHVLFRNAPHLGSLINPTDVPVQGRMFMTDYRRVEPLLQRALARDRNRDDPVASVFGVAAEGIARAARLLSGTYTLVATNVPYLARGKQDQILTAFCDVHYPASRTDLATVFVERCRAFTMPCGAYALVTPQNWLFLPTYERLRRQFLQQQTWNMVARLGEGGFQSSMAAGAFTALLIVTQCLPDEMHTFASIEAAEPRTPQGKSLALQRNPITHVVQCEQLRGRQAAIALARTTAGAPLDAYARLYEGMKPGQTQRVTRKFWEIDDFERWFLLSSSPSGDAPYSGNSEVILDPARIQDQGISEANTSGRDAWGKRGVLISKMRRLPAALYLGAIYDNNTFAIVPHNEDDLPALWAFVSSDAFSAGVRAINQKLDAALSSVGAVHFDRNHWRAVASSQGALPEPASNDPTQWLFQGHPAGSTTPLQVAVARLLGYRWPAQQDVPVIPARNSPERRKQLREAAPQYDSLDRLADADGIVCLPAIAGERPAHERLRALLATACGDGWSVAVQDELLARVGFAGTSLEAWLRDGFFKQHCELFHNRPFIWHIWDGLRDGFSALVNYHRLDRARLEKLIYTCLGAWIRDRRAERDAGVPGAEGKLVAALELQKKLEAILEGEPPYDIYVRWKPLAQQPIGWEPDLNDGVRLNIRPFVTAGVLRSKFTINWNKDRGTNPDGSERRNDLHLSNEEKRRARAIGDS